MLTLDIIQSNLISLVEYLRLLGIKVVLCSDGTSDVTIAQLRNRKITVNTQNRDGLNCIFTISHLFGHLVQFLNYDKYEHLTLRMESPKPIHVDERFRRAFYKYEIEAFRIGKGLMLSCFRVPREMDIKFTLFMETDFAHYWQFVTTGEGGDIRTFNEMLERSYRNWKVNDRILQPLAHPKTFKLRHSAVVNVI